MTSKKLIAILLASVMLFSMAVTTAVNAAEDKLPFSDVANDWAYEPIKYVYENGLMNGTGGTNFSPKTPLTRAMVVTVLYRLAGSPAAYYKRGDCLDLEPGQYYTEAVTWALKNGVVNGTHSDDWGVPYFSPDRNITRQELATLFVRFATYQKVILSKNGDISGFVDASSVASWAEDAMKWATDAGLINGTGDGTTLSPTGEATREQFAAIVYRYCTGEFDYELFYAEPMTGNSYKKPTFELCTDADVYVAVDGNDKNPGTLDKPLATLEGARNKVRELKKTAKDEIVVAFKAGEYESPDNLTFTAEDSGTASVPVTYRVYGNGDVVFNGGFTVKANEFTAITDEEAKKFPKDAVPYIKKADISDRLPEEITVNNYLFSNKFSTMCWQARDLNKDLSGSDKYYFNQTTEGDLKTCVKLLNKLSSTVEGFSSLDGLWIKAQLQTGYTFDVYKVAGYDPETQLLYLDIENWVGLNADYYQNHTGFRGLANETRFPDQFFFYNLPEFLDASGEYWIDETNRVMYVYDPLGDYTYSVGGAMMTFEEGCDYINIIGLQFKGSAVDSMIYVNGDHFTFDGCRFGAYSGRYAVITHMVNNFRMENCELYAFPACGIRVFSDADRNNIICANNVVRKNYFHDYGNPEYWSTALDLINDVGAVIEHNEFKNAGHGGVSFYDSIDTIIQYNIFDHLMHSTTDYGAIYTHRGCAFRDNVIRYNLFKNFYSYNQAYCFYNDGSYGQQFYGNIFYEVYSNSYVCNDGRDNVINDNILINPNGIDSFLAYNPGPYLALTDEGKMGDVNGLIEHMNNRVMPGEEGYEKWYERWTIMYEYNYDKASSGDFNSFYSTINYVNRNKLFISSQDKNETPNFGEVAEKFGVMEGNEFYSFSTNPYFRNPSVGDYTVVTNADDFENIYDFSLIGIIN